MERKFARRRPRVSATWGEEERFGRRVFTVCGEGLERVWRELMGEWRNCYWIWRGELIERGEMAGKLAGWKKDSLEISLLAGLLC